MIRRYSRPRTFRAGWTTPRRPWTTKSIGFTTMPSPPASVRSSHHAAPSAAGRVSGVDAQVLRQPEKFLVSRAKCGDPLEMPGVRLVDVDGVLAREDVEGRELEVGHAAH